MLIGKITALLILFILIVYNSINTRFQPFILLAAYVLAVFLSWLEMMIRHKYICCRFGEAKYVATKDCSGGFSFEIVNRYFLPFTRGKIKLRGKMTGVNAVKEVELEVFCPPKCTNRYTLSLPDSHCAIWTVSGVSGCYYDFFRIFKHSISRWEDCAFIVMPGEGYDLEGSMHEISKVFREEEINSNAKGNDNTEVSDVRQYRAGDKLNWIHWKMSVKTGTLMTKEGSNTVSRKIKIYFDCSAKPDEFLTVRDAALFALYGFGRWLCDNGFCYEIVFIDRKVRGSVANRIENDDPDRGLGSCFIQSEKELINAVETLLEKPCFMENGSLLHRYNMDRHQAHIDVFYVSDKGIGGV